MKFQDWWNILCIALAIAFVALILMGHGPDCEYPKYWRCK